VLSVRDLDVFYGNAQALRGVSLEVHEGEVVAILGANGAGKTTLLRTISGLVRARAGAIRFGDRAIDRDAPNEIVSLGISQCPEGRKLFPRLSVHKNLLLGAYVFRRERRKVQALMEEVFAMFPILRERREQHAGTLSGGEQQMLALGRALMAKPRLLLLDETSMGLAPKVIESLFRSIRAINERGVTVVVVEQNAAKALEVSSRAYVLESGRVAISGESAAMRSDPKIREAYLGI
jgi:branched-chain amino acid transport system ATP-binding protein